MTVRKKKVVAKDQAKEIRHYCCLCGAKRQESVMHTVRRAAFGKMSWACNTCGDSRFKEVTERTPTGMQFVMDSKPGKWRRR